MNFRSCKSCAHFFNKIKCLTRSKTVKHKYTTFCFSSAVATKLSCDGRRKIQEPDASKLTREYLIHSSSISTAENAVTLLTQTALALQHADSEYKEALLALVFLLELKLTILGNSQEEARLWDLVLEGRSLVASSKKKRDDLEMLFSRCQALVNNAAEISYMTGADIIGNSVGDRLNKLEMVITEERLKSEQAEKRLQETEIKSINAEGKYAEEHADELEIERQKVVQILTASNSEEELKGQETEGRESREPDITDILDNASDNLTDNAAEEI
ncbi:uncharacterized protein LOC132742691 [Ruditapes philippinarum]|uniref:uncharacterized protein LOC132742691 n=1 Tax=Ruditapes philippinarum TaxID=129788 RepID=UPI00295B3A47|nr:uncharacterized protein LOC132742691 [Ruditapes philippinarum]